MNTIKTTSNHNYFFGFSNPGYGFSTGYFSWKYLSSIGSLFDFIDFA